MRYIINDCELTDIQIVPAFVNDDRLVQQFWFCICRSRFSSSRHRYAGIADYERQDIFAESFSLMWEQMHSGRIFVSGSRVCVKSPEGVREIPDLLGYFMRIVRNKYLERLRDGRHIAVNEAVTADRDEVDAVCLYWDEDPEVEKDRLVVSCLRQLPKSCVEILTMFYYERKSLEQILEERPENSSYDGLKSRKSKCMSNLKKRITEAFAKAGLR